MGLIKIPAIYDYVNTIHFPGVDGKSIAFATSNEFMADTSISCPHLRNKFTIAVWAKPANTAPVKTFLSPGSVPNILFQMSTATNWRLIIRAIPETSVIQKNYNVTITNPGNWHHFAIVVDRGASEQLKMYFDGEVQTPSKSTDNSLSDRSGYNCSQIQTAGNQFDGNIHSWAIWDTNLNDGAIKSIYNNGNEVVDLLNKYGKYKQHRKLQHWFVPELDDTNLGKDYGKSKNETDKINLMNNQLGITAAEDLVIDTPSGR